MKKTSLIFFAFICLAVCIGCTTIYNELPAMNEQLNTNDLKAIRSAVESAKKNDSKSSYNQKNNISFLLDRGMLAFYDGDYAGSAPDLIEAERLMEEAFTKSVRDNFIAFVSKNPNKAEYQGEDFEDIYVNVFSALSFFNTGDIERALVEVRRVNQKLVYKNDEYEAYQARLMTRFKDRVFGKVTYYTNSALANYLAMLFWRGSNNPDSARIDAQSITNAFNEAPHLYSHPIPSELVMRNNTNEELSVPAGMARMNFLVFTGLSPYKIGIKGKEMGQEMPNFKVFAYRNSPADRIEVVFDNGTRRVLSLLEPMDKITQEIFETRENQRRNVWALYNNISNYGKSWAIGIADLFTFVFTFGNVDIAAKRAKDAEAKNNVSLDLRMGRFMPGKAYVGGVNLRPGTYSFIINYYAGQKLLNSKRIENKSINENSLNLVQDSNLAHDLFRTPGTLTEESIAAMPNFPGRLPAPTGFRIESGTTTDELTFYTYKWDPVPGAVAYYVYDKYKAVYVNNVLNPFAEGDKYDLFDITQKPESGMSFWGSRPGACAKVIAVGAGGLGIPSQTF